MVFELLQTTSSGQNISSNCKQLIEENLFFDKREKKFVKMSKKEKMNKKMCCQNLQDIIGNAFSNLENVQMFWFL